MKMTVWETLFVDEFSRMGREDSFSREALEEIYDFITGMEELDNEEWELDVIDICTHFAEYEDMDAYFRDHKNLDREDYPDIDSLKAVEMTVLEIPGYEKFVTWDGGRG